MKTTSNLIVLLVTSSDELQGLVNRVASAARDYNMTTNAAKTKTMTNTEDALEIEVDTKRLKQVNS